MYYDSCNTMVWVEKSKPDICVALDCGNKGCGGQKQKIMRAKVITRTLDLECNFK